MNFPFLKNKSVRYSWIISYLVILLVAVISETVIYFINIRIIEDEINSSNELVIGEIKGNVDNMLRDIERFSIAVATNQNVLSALTVNDPDNSEAPYRIYKVIQELNNSMTYNSYIKKYFINFNNLNTVVFPGAAYSQETFFNTYIGAEGTNMKQWLSMLEKPHDGDFIIMPFHDEITGDKDYVAYVRSIPLVGPNSANLVVLLDFNELVNKNTGQNDSFRERRLHIIDQDRNIIAGEGALSGIDYSKLEGEYGVDNQTVDGWKTVISYATSRINGWKYITLTPESVFWERLQLIRYVMLGGLFFCVLFGALVSYFFMRRNYNPLREVVTYFHNKLNMQSDNENNEYGFIQKALSDTLEQKVTISMKLEQQNNTLKSYFIGSLLKGSDMAAPLHELLTMHNINFQYDNFTVMAIYINKIDEGFWDGVDTGTIDKYSISRFVITNVVLELINRKYYGIYSEVDDILACIINLNNDAETYKKELTDIVYEAREFLQSNFKITLAFSVGSLYSSMNGIPEAFNEAVNAMEYLKVMGLEKPIFYDQIADTKQSRYYYPVEKESLLINCIKSADYKAAVEIIEEIFQRNFVNNSNSLEMTRCIMFDMISTLLKTVNEIEKLDDSVVELLKCKNYMDMKNKMLKIVEELCNYILSTNVNTDYNIRDMVVGIILEKFSDPNLGIANISEQIGKYPYYVSRIFKEQTGEGILEYINRVRINKAKEFLKEGLWNQEEIAEKVGYTNVRTFYRAFKKHEGITPGKLKS